MIYFCGKTKGSRDYSFGNENIKNVFLQIINQKRNENESYSKEFQSVR